MAIIVDIDGTLADNSHRQHFLQGEKKDWGAFFEAMKDDRPIMPIVRLVQDLYRSNQILLCSGRPQLYYITTHKWLHDNHIPFHAVYMRKNDDYRPDNIVKRELLAIIREHGYEPTLVIDDRTSVVNMWRDVGLTCLAMEDKIQC